MNRRVLSLQSKNKWWSFLTILLALMGSTVFAQEYEFNFYNGDVAERAEPQAEPPKVPEQKPVIVAPVESATVREKVAPPSQEKLKRTGVSLIAGYAQHDFGASGGLFNDLSSETFRAGLTFVSSYDFNLDVEFLSSSVVGDLSGFKGGLSLSGRAQGLGVGVRNNYWLAENIGISLGASVKGVKGTLGSALGDYSYRNYGGALAAGPTFQVGRAQVLLAYEYGVDNIYVEGENDSDFDEQEWVQNSTIKGMLSYRF